MFFESANRVKETLDLVFKTLGNRNVCAAREISKMHEEIVTNELENVIKFFNENSGKLRGANIAIS